MHKELRQSNLVLRQKRPDLHKGVVLRELPRTSPNWTWCPRENNENRAFHRPTRERKPAEAARRHVSRKLLHFNQAGAAEVGAPA